MVGCVAGAALPEEKDGWRVQEVEPGKKATAEEGRLKGAGLKVFFDIKASKTIVNEIANMACLQRRKTGGQKKILALGKTGDTREEIKEVKGGDRC